MLTKFLQNTLQFGHQIINKSNEDDKYNKELLPGDLAGKILNLQIECQSSVTTPELIASLIALYTNAIQYYESISSLKYAIYRKRMHDFLSKKSVQSILRGSTVELIIKKQSAQRNRNHALYSTKEEVNRIIQKSIKKEQHAKTLIQKQIKSQEQQLDARISRRRTMSNKSTKTDNDTAQDLQVCPRQIMSTNLILGDIKQRNIKRVFI